MQDFSLQICGEDEIGRGFQDFQQSMGFRFRVLAIRHVVMRARDAQRTERRIPLYDRTARVQPTPMSVRPLYSVFDFVKRRATLEMRREGAEDALAIRGMNQLFPG